MAFSLVRPFVIKLGGSFMLADGKANVKDFVDMASTVRKFVNNGHKIVVVVGGGTTARHYIAAAEALGANNGVKDYMGILVSRLNARLFIEAMGSEYAYSDPPESLPELRKAMQIKPVVVVGGLQPGQSTTAVSALCAEYLNATKVYFCTDVDGVYTADPRKDTNAKKLDLVSYRDLEKLTGTENSAPGQYRLMDGVAITILERSKIPALIFKGTTEALEKAVGGAQLGTQVGPTNYGLPQNMVRLVCTHINYLKLIWIYSYIFLMSSK